MQDQYFDLRYPAQPYYHVTPAFNPKNIGYDHVGGGSLVQVSPRGGHSAANGFDNSIEFRTRPEQAHF